MTPITFEGLTEEEIEIISRIADLFRSTRKREEHNQFKEIWDRIRAKRSFLSEEEADALALEAVAAVRKAARESS